MELLKRLQTIRMLVLDVDGVLTNCEIWLDANNQWRRSWNVRDGAGIRILLELGYQMGVITAALADDIENRCQWLKIPHVYMGAQNKLPAFNDILNKTGLQAHEVAYMGDDIFDVPVLERVGFAATVPGGVYEARGCAHYITEIEGGRGAVREVCDLIRKHGYYAQLKG